MRFRIVQIVLVLGLLLTSCSRQKDSSPVTMLVTQGFSEEYCKIFAEDVKENLGIDIEFVYENATNQSMLIVQNCMNNDLPADIVFTYAKIQDKYLQNCSLDFISHSSLISRYPYTVVSDLRTKNGCVYQLPLSSRLVGITYNATLMKEMGWNCPKNFQEMVDLKRQCDEQNIPFAYTDIRLSGLPFNYLFNLMGSQWLSTIKGTVWLEGFLQGTKTMTVFKEKSVYFKKWVESGLFGQLLGTNTDARQEFGRKRALFLYSNRNTSYGYDGPMYDADGQKTDVILHDEHKTMPWISEDGSNNCFTIYNNCWAMVNGSLGEKGKEAKLERVLKVLEYLLNEKYTNMTAEAERDIFISMNDYEIGKDRLFYEFADQIKRGFLQPWYYNLFDEGTVAGTGAEVGSYMLNAARKMGQDMSIRRLNYEFNPYATFDSAIGMLRNTLHAQQEDYLGWADEQIVPRGVALMVAIAGGMSLQEELDDMEVTVGLLPYAQTLKDLQPWRPVAVQNASAYPGALQKAYASVFEPAGCIEVVGVRMTGFEIKDLLSHKYDPSGYFIDGKTGESSFDKEHYGPYPYACAVKGNQRLYDDQEYIVAVSPRALPAELYQQFLKDKKVITTKRGRRPVIANVAHGINLYFEKHPSINNSNINWDVAD